MARADWTSWLSGPREALEQQGVELGRPGERLGLPTSGPGSIAPIGRRLVALCIDWFACSLIVRATAGPNHPLLVLEVFYAQVAVLTAFTGASFGQGLLGIAVRDVRGGRLSVLRIAVRTLLVCLVVPAMIWDRDTRGGHDLAVGGVVLRAGRS